MTTYILAIQIGPMQQFIKAARRTRDLWYGSWLMSELSKTVARTVAEEAGIETLVFPTATAEQLAPGSDYSVANKIVAVVSSSPKAIAKKAEEAMKNYLSRTLLAIDKQVQTRLKAASANNVNEQSKTMWDIALQQSQDLPEFYWAALPLMDIQQYRNVRLKVEGLLAARKNCRDFKAVSWQSATPKSSLSGNLESVIPESYYPKRNAEDRDQKIKDLYSIFRARGAERLSGVDLLKRLGKLGEQDSFPSTSHMATTPLRQRLATTNGEVKTRWKKYIETIEDIRPEVIRDEMIGKGQPSHPVFGKADGSLLFESRLRDYFDKDVPKEVAKALSCFYALNEVPEPISYYAIMLGDGDFMGKALNKLTKPEAHRCFSRILSQFADGMRPLIESQAYGGALIYAGGDDVMALLPLHTAVSCAHAVKKAFDEKMAQMLTEVNPLLDDCPLTEPPTFSAGIAIVHHLEPLEDALELARAAEKVAKGIADGKKNALAISLDKRSGVTRTVVGKWDTLKPNLEAIAGFYQNDMLPYGLPYHLQAMLQELGGETAVKSDLALQAVVKKETARIVKRKQGEMAKEVKAFLDEQAKRIGQTYTVTTFINELIIANILAKATKQSEGK